MRIHFRSLRSSKKLQRRGATVVEMAFAAPLLFLIVFIVFEFGYALMMHHLMLDVAREGARIAALPQGTSAAVNTQVNQMLSDRGVRGASLRILINGAENDLETAATGDSIQLRIELPASNFLPLPKHFITGSLIANCDRRKE